MKLSFSSHGYGIKTKLGSVSPIKSLSFSSHGYGIKTKQ